MGQRRDDGRGRATYDRAPSSRPRLLASSTSSSRVTPSGLETCSHHKDVAAPTTKSPTTRTYTRVTTEGVPQRETPGGLGPGAEPPVAIASRAFAHEERDTKAKRETNKTADDVQGGVGTPSDDNIEMGSGSGYGGGVGATGGGADYSDEEKTCTAAALGLDTNEIPYGRASDGKHASDRADFLAPECGDKSEEAETLLDTYNLSDEAVLEGAPTGCSAGGGGGGSTGGDVPDCVFFPPTNKRQSGISRVEDEQYVGESSGGDDDARCHAISDDITSDDLSSSSSTTRRNLYNTSRPQRQQQRSGGIPRRRPFVQPRKQATNRIVPFEHVNGVAESEGGRRRYGRNKGRRCTMSPRRGNRAAFSSGSHDGRSLSQQQNHRRNGRRERLVLSEAESAAGDDLGMDWFEEEMARLRRENTLLKRRQQHRLIRYIFCDLVPGVLRSELKNPSRKYVPISQFRVFEGFM